MRSGEEIAVWLLSQIDHMYKRPAMYARTQSDLAGALRMLHAAWACSVGRDEDYLHACPAIGHNRPDTYFTKIQGAGGFDGVVAEWLEFDRRFGIKLPE